MLFKRSLCLLRSLFLSQKKAHSLIDKSLVELHLGTMAVSADQLIEVLQMCPNLKLLRHYQLVSALYKLHSETWKGGGSVPRYKLTNLDADFSHVVCTFVRKTRIIMYEYVIENYEIIQEVSCTNVLICQGFVF